MQVQLLAGRSSVTHRAEPSLRDPKPVSARLPASSDVPMQKLAILRKASADAALHNRRGNCVLTCVLKTASAGNWDIDRQRRNAVSSGRINLLLGQSS